MRKTIKILPFLFFLIIPFNTITYGKSDSCNQNGLCEPTETALSCPDDCNKYNCSRTYRTTDRICNRKGWKKESIRVNGIVREFYWKAPPVWNHGAIITLHGGGGTDANFCSSLPKLTFFWISDILRGEPVQEFAEMAIDQGFAVFSIDSSYNRATDPKGRPIGKRWDCVDTKGRENIDLPFIKQMITDTIPNLRPTDSSSAIFLTGISNGGFTTILAATRFAEHIDAFAPVSAGDPYATYLDMNTHPKKERECAPGVFRDSETRIMIHIQNACSSEISLVTDPLPQNVKRPPFKQFHHEGDGACDISCMRKVRKRLISWGYKDHGSVILHNGKRNIENHFWQREYSQEIIDFFKENSK